MRSLLAIFAGLILVSADHQAVAPRKLALIVAISNYNPLSGYSRINAANDVPLVRAALMSQGFQDSAITVLRDAQATRDAILEAIQSLADRASEGDAVVFHYSGHGHRLTDDDGDELDGYDEVLVPYDAWIPVDGAAGALQHLRDDDLGIALDALRRKAGKTGSVAVFLDACYSGSGTRAGPGEPAIRGVADPIRTTGANVSRDSDKAGGVEELATRSSEGLAPLVVISAARHDQVARETYDSERRPVGSLSLAMSIAMPRLSRDATYRTLHDRIAAAMAGMQLLDQRPQVEGSIDARVFSGDIVEQTPYHRIVSVLGDTVIRVQGGRLLGLLPGSKVEFHPPGTIDPRGSTAIGKGTVTAADAIAATVKLEPSARVPRDVWAFVSEYAYGETEIRIRIDRNVSAAARSAISRALSGLAVVKISNDAAHLTMRTAAGARAIEMVDVASGVRIGNVIDLDGAPEQVIRGQILSLARSMIIRGLELQDPRVRVRLALIRTVPRVRISGNDTTCALEPPVQLPGEFRSAEGMVLAPGDEYTLRISNDGSAPAYVAVLDITPDGQIRQIFPLEGHTGSDNLIPPQSEFLIPDVCFFAEPPAGVEMLKLFATRQRIDFAPILTGSGSRGEDDSPLTRLFRDVHDGTRSAPLAATGAGTTATLSLTILPDKRK